MVLVEEEECVVEGVGKIQQTIDSTMGSTTCSFDEASLLADLPAMNEMMESASIVGAAEEEEEEVEEVPMKLLKIASSNDRRNLME